MEKSISNLEEESLLTKVESPGLPIKTIPTREDSPGKVLSTPPSNKLRPASIAGNSAFASGASASKLVKRGQKGSALDQGSEGKKPKKGTSNFFVILMIFLVWCFIFWAGISSLFSN
jgi:hypothetical protein